MNPRVLVFSLSLVLFFLSALMSVGPAASQEEQEGQELLWGFWSGGEGDVVKPVHPATVLCVWGEGPVHLDVDREQHPGYRFDPGHEPVCRMVSGGLPLRVEEASGEIRVVAMRVPPRVLESPGVTPLAEEGSGVLVRGLSPDGEVTVSSGGEGFRVNALAWPSLGPLQVDEGPQERRVQAPVDEDVLVVVVSEGPQQALLRWRDPGWFPVAPNIGQVLAPVALALLVSLFRGGAGGPWIRPGAAKRRRGAFEQKGMGKEEGPDGPSAASGR